MKYQDTKEGIQDYFSMEYSHLEDTISEMRLTGGERDKIDGHLREINSLFKKSLDKIEE